MGGKLIIFTAPSGAGKTTIVQHLVNKYDELEFSVSACTRPKRSNEIHGKHYYFISVEEFKEKILNDEFVEWEEVYEGNFYGTLKSELERIWKEGKNVVFDVDVQGALRIQKAHPDITLSIFVKPPSLEVLKERLKSRATESSDSLAARIKKAENELKFENAFNKVIVNDKLDDAIKCGEMLIKNFLRNE